MYGAIEIGAGWLVCLDDRGIPSTAERKHFELIK